MRVAVTGPRGYVGARIKSYLEEQGCQVISLTRSPSDGTAPFDLRQDVSAERFKGIDVLVHCAYDFSAIQWEDILKVNVEGSRRLLQSARTGGVSKIIFISSMSAFRSCQSFYGRAKLMIEAEAARLGAAILRPGLVYDSKAGGMVGALRKAVEKSPFIPLIGWGDQQLYLLHSEDLCRFVFQIAAEHVSYSTEPVILAHEQGFTFRAILKIIAEVAGKSPVLVPTPAAGIYAGLKLAELLGIRGRLRSDGVKSLIHFDRKPSFSEMRRLGFVPRPFSDKALQEPCKGMKS